MKRLFDQRELATELGLSQRSLERYRLQGNGPRYVRVGLRLIRYRQEDVEAWINQSLRTSTSDVGGK